MMPGSLHARQDTNGTTPPTNDPSDSQTPSEKPITTPMPTDTAPSSDPGQTSNPPPTSSDPPPSSDTHTTPPPSTATTPPPTATTPPVTHTTPPTTPGTTTTKQQQSSTPPVALTTTTPALSTAFQTSLVTSFTYSSVSAIESTFTSVNSTLALGNKECASDANAQTDGTCPGTMYCNAPTKQCVAKSSNGATCAADFQCLTDYCTGTCTDRPASSTNNGSLAPGAIAGIVIGVVGGLAVIAALFFFWRKRRNRNNVKMYAQEFNDVFPEMQAKRASKYNFLAQMLSKDQLPLESHENLMNAAHSRSISQDRASSAASPYLGHLDYSPQMQHQRVSTGSRPVSGVSGDYALDFSDYADTGHAQQPQSFTRQQQPRTGSMTALQPRPVLASSPPPSNSPFASHTPSLVMPVAASVGSPALSSSSAHLQQHAPSPRQRNVAAAGPPRPRPDSEALPAIDTTSFMKANEYDNLWDDALVRPAGVAASSNNIDAWTHEDQATMSPVDSSGRSGRTFSPQPSTLGHSSTLRTASTQNTQQQQHSPFF
ncbi:hypothetical protein BC940DRAFT_295462 [Gongronella butleri]|nr:hypothetical protein BC940DRAFT_295462 [Gongronella butleri]